MVRWNVGKEVSYEDLIATVNENDPEDTGAWLGARIGAPSKCKQCEVCGWKGFNQLFTPSLTLVESLLGLQVQMTPPK